MNQRMNIDMAYQRVTLRWLLVLLLFTVAAIYLPGLGGGFAFDDMPNIVDNAALRVDFGAGWLRWMAAAFSSPAADLPRPLSMVTFALDHAIDGLDPRWMKAGNVAIHLLNTGLLFGLCRRQLRALRDLSLDPARCDRVALWIAAAWALNPINLTAVLLVVQRMECLAHTFVIAGLWWYVAGRARAIAGDGRVARPLIGLAVATGVGVLAKESAALLPLYALLVEWIVFRREASNARPLDRHLLTAFAAAVVVTAVCAMGWLTAKALQPGAYGGRGFTLGERLLTEARIVLDYLRWTVLPHLRELGLYHDDYRVSHGWLTPATTLPAAVMVGALAVAVPLLRRRRPLLALGLGWFLLAHLLTATVVPLELIFEHRNYFASLGVCVALADLLLVAPQSGNARRAGRVLAAALLVFYAGTTLARAVDWSSPLRFATTEAARHPQSPRATYSLARELIIRTGYRPDAPDVPAARRALDVAMRAPGATPLPAAVAILFEARLGAPVPPAYWTEFQRKLRTEPLGVQSTTALASLVDCDLKQQCALSRDAMQASLQAALDKGPNAEVLNIYGNFALNALHDQALALRLWRDAAQRAPRVVEYQATMAKLLIAMGREDEARTYIARVRALGKLGQTEVLARQLEARMGDPK